MSNGEVRAEFLRDIIKGAAAPERAEHYFQRLMESPAAVVLRRADEDQRKVLAALFSGSPALSDQLVANLDWLPGLEIGALRHPRRKQGLQRDLDRRVNLVSAARNYEEALTRLRKFKQFEMLRIAARDLGRLSNAMEIVQEISDVADVCLEAVWRICRQQFNERFGQPYHPDPSGQWHETAACVLGLGKLGGRELNYSSDVDVMFLYADEGQVFRHPPGRKGVPPIRVMSNHQYFNRLAEAFIAEVARMTPDSMLFRIDLRLRPEGDAGPLSRSLESCENYYAQWGQTWERMMLIKGRGVAGDGQLAAEFLEMIQPFRFPRSLNEGVLREIAGMKDRIENEVVRSGELDRNVKLGRGGIREIEFVVQSLQLLHAGRQPFLQNPQTLPCLAKLAEYELLKREDAADLDKAYCFFRDVEHRLQMEGNRQTHSIPADNLARERLAKLMSFNTVGEFEAARSRHSNNVRRVYDTLLKGGKSEQPSAFPPTFESSEAEWKKLFAEHSIRDPDAALRVFKEFVEGPGFVHVSSRTTELARRLLPKIFGLCPKRDVGGNSLAKSAPFALRLLSDPDRVVTRIDSFITAYGTRAALFDLWTSHVTLFELLILLFDRSEFLAETIIRSPELYDELVFGDRLRQRKGALEILEDLRHGLKDEDQFLWLRRYHEAELLRLGSRDILGLVDFEQNLGELSSLADACLQYALESVMTKHKMKSAPFAVVGLGKLGGREITYGSDLDIVFVADSKTKDLPALQKLAVELMELVSRRTDKGTVFQVDARLRPDGEKGLLVNTLAAYEEYYCQRAQLWEIQALSRARAVAGDGKLGKEFQALAARLTDFKSVIGKTPVKKQINKAKGKTKKTVKEKSETFAVSYKKNWKADIQAMRMRIEKERTPVGKDELAIKTGKGGLMDAEFIAQAVCLENGWHEPHTLRALERGRDAKVLPDADRLLENYAQLRRVEGILRRWSYEGETVLPDDPAPYYRVSVRCGFMSPEEFRQALAKWRGEIREVYNQFFPTLTHATTGQ